MNVQLKIDGDNPGAEKLRQLGDLLYICFRSPRHGNQFLDRVRAVIQPPVDLGQVIVFRDQDKPIAFISWAFFSEKAERAYLKGEPLAPSDWRSGSRFWCVEMVSLLPDGYADRLARKWLNSIPSHTNRMQFLRTKNASDTIRHVVFERKNNRWGLGDLGLKQGKS